MLSFGYLNGLSRHSHADLVGKEFGHAQQGWGVLLDHQGRVFQLFVFLQTIPEGYIVLDTQLIIGGKNAQMQIGIDDYCLAANSGIHIECLVICLHNTDIHSACC